MFSRAYSNIKILLHFHYKVELPHSASSTQISGKKELLYLRTLTITWAQSPKSGSGLSCLRECLAKWSQVRGKYTLETRNIRGVIPAAESQHNPVRWIQSRLAIWYHGAVPHIIYSFAIDTRKFLNNELKGRYSCGGNKSQSQEINKTQADVSFILTTSFAWRILGSRKEIHTPQQLVSTGWADIRLCNQQIITTACRPGTFGNIYAQTFA